MIDLENRVDVFMMNDGNWEYFVAKCPNCDFGVLLRAPFPHSSKNTNAIGECPGCQKIIMGSEYIQCEINYIVNPKEVK